MPLPVASDILRRLQNTIYQPWEDTQQPATLDSAHSAPTLNTNTDTETDSSRNDLHNFNFGAHGATTSPSPSSPPPQSSSPPFENLYPRPASELSNTRRRQPSTPAVSAPDVNAQSVLRKRILEIQSLGLPEREKARLIQVTPPSLFLNHVSSSPPVGINDRSISRCSATSKRLAVGTTSARRTHRKGLGKNIS
jgi:hypothetical protein